MLNRSHRRSQPNRRQTYEDAAAESNNNSGYSNDGRIPRYLDGSSNETRYRPAVDSGTSRSGSGGIGRGRDSNRFKERRGDEDLSTIYQDINPGRRVGVEVDLEGDEDPPRYENIYPELSDTTQLQTGYTDSGESKEQGVNGDERRYQSRSRSSRSTNSSTISAISSTITSSLTTTARTTNMNDTIFAESELEPAPEIIPIRQPALTLESPIGISSSGSTTSSHTDTQVFDDSIIYNLPNHIHMDHQYPQYRPVVHMIRPKPLFPRSRIRPSAPIDSYPYFPEGHGSYFPERPYGYPIKLINEDPTPISIIGVPQADISIFHGREQQTNQDEEERSTARTTEFYPAFPLDLPPSNPYAITDIDWNFPEGNRFPTEGYESHLDEQSFDLPKSSDNISFSGRGSSMAHSQSHSSAANLPSHSGSPSINVSINLSISSQNPNQVADTLSIFSLGLRDLSDSLRDR